MTAARMHHKIKRTFLIFVNFDKMIAAAKCSNTSFRLCLVNRFITIQLIKPNPIAVFMTCFSDCSANWNIVPNNSIQLLTLYILCFHFCKRHSAADIHSNKIWKQQTAHCHCQTDSPYFSRMHIWHNAYLASCCTWMITNHLKLTACIIINCILFIVCCVYNCIRIFSIYCNHKNLHSYQNLRIWA